MAVARLWLIFISFRIESSIRQTIRIPFEIIGVWLLIDSDVSRVNRYGALLSAHRSPFSPHELDHFRMVDFAIINICDSRRADDPFV